MIPPPAMIMYCMAIGRPKTSISFTTDQSIFRASGLNSMYSIVRTRKKQNTKDTNWDITEAIAAPKIPHLKTNTNRHKNRRVNKIEY